MYSLRMLFYVLSIVLVELWQVLGPRCSHAGLSMDDWFSRSKHQRTIGSIEGSILRLQMSHHYELHQDLSKGELLYGILEKLS